MHAELTLVEIKDEAIFPNTSNNRLRDQDYKGREENQRH